VRLLLDGMRKYCSCPTEASNSAPIESKNEEKVPDLKKELVEIV
jgi:hypothetical protein